MSITARQEQILYILNERTFITVNELAKITYTSPSSIRRDLIHMQNNGLVRRCHGGVSLPAPISGVASFYDRAHKNIHEKRIIAKKAAVLLRDGQNILLDSSSTAAFLLPHIARLSSATVFTNNLSTALNAIELGIHTHCLGGRSANGSAVLSGAETIRALSGIKADILFFSSQSIDRNGLISDSTEEENFVRQCMLHAAETSVFLCDNEKFDKSSLYTLCTLGEVDFAAFDTAYTGSADGCTLL